MPATNNQPADDTRPLHDNDDERSEIKADEGAPSAAQPKADADDEENQLSSRQSSSSTGSMKKKSGKKSKKEQQEDHLPGAYCWPGWKFIVQVVISLMVLAFALGMLADQKKDKDTRLAYLPIVSGILGYWLPSPAGQMYDKLYNRGNDKEE